VRISVKELEVEIQECTTRIPFRFGVHTLTDAPMAIATVTAETSTGTLLRGYTSELLVPRWFEKNLLRSVEEDIQSLVDSISMAGDVLLDGSCSTVFDHYWRMLEDRVLATPVTAEDRLTRGLGCAIWERALMDAACRGVGLPFLQSLEVGLFGIEPHRFHPQLQDWKFTPSPLPPTISVRHTVGLLDDLEERSDDSVEDGLPVTLVEDIRRHGLRWFKVKVGGDPDHDLERLQQIAAILRRESGDGYRVTLDGNEQYEDPASLAAVLDELNMSADGVAFLEAIVSIEQPVPRSKTFEAASAPTELSRHGPVIIDEADHGPEAFPEALGLGYLGVSSKNCKGVSRSIAHQGLCQAHGAGAFVSGEDLTCLPPWGLHQDLLTVAALGLTHVERNGHHYFRGLDHLTSDESSQLLKDHPDLYRSIHRGDELLIENGVLCISSLDCEGYGCTVRPSEGSRRTVIASRMEEKG